MSPLVASDVPIAGGRGVLELACTTPVEPCNCIWAGLLFLPPKLPRLAYM